MNRVAACGPAASFLHAGAENPVPGRRYQFYNNKKNAKTAHGLALRPTVCPLDNGLHRLTLILILGTAIAGKAAVTGRGPHAPRDTRRPAKSAHAIRTKTSRPDQELLQAQQWVEWGDWNRARDLLEASLGHSPIHARILAYYAHVLNAFGDHKKAIKMARQGLKINPRCGECHLYLAEALGARIKKMNHFRALWNLPQLRRQLRQAMRDAPQTPNAYWGYINFYMQAPAAVGGSLDKAYQYAQKLGHYDPVDGKLAEASIEKARGQMARALSDYQTAIQTHPRDPRGYFHLGRTLFLSGHYRQAARALEQAHHLSPHSAVYRAWYAAELVHLHRMTAAWRLLQGPGAGNRLGYFLVAQALKATGQNFNLAKQLLARYLAAPAEPRQPSRQKAQLLLASLG